jgi:hypothetical protein
MGFERMILLKCLANQKKEKTPPLALHASIADLSLLPHI